MTPEQFMECFGVVAEAEGGIRKLRDLVLSLAIRGRLSERCEGDGDAREVLQMVDEKRAPNTRQKRSKSSATQVEIPEDPYPLPKRWTWCTLSRVAIFRDGERVPVSKADREHRRGRYDYYGASGVIDSIDDYLFDDPLLLVGEDGANLLLRSKPIAFIARGQYWVNNHAHVLDSANEDVLRYLELFINATDLAPYVTGTAQPKMNQAKMNTIPIALPPLAEERRIVAKVDRLMAMLDDLQQRLEKKRTAAIHVSKTSLDSLVSAETAEDLVSTWKQVSERFAVVLGAPHGIRNLRIALRALAVAGKLGTGRTEDPPVGNIIQRIQVLVDQAVSDKAVKKLPPAWEKPAFALPARWEWVRLGDILAFGPRNGYSPTPVDHETPTRSLTLSATTSGRFDPSCSKFVDVAVPSDSHLWLRSGDILVQRANTIDYVGVSAVYHGPPNIFIYPDLMMKIRVVDLLDSDFIHLAMSSVEARSYLRARASGTSGSMPKINQAALVSLPIALPPVEEQRRIVAVTKHLNSQLERVVESLNIESKARSRLVECVSRAGGLGAA